MWVNGYCQICGEDISDNVDDTRILECGMCVQRRVKYIERLELEAQMDINNRVDLVTARKKAKENPYHPTRGGTTKVSAAPQSVSGGILSTNFQCTDRKVTPIKWKDQLL